MKKVRIEFHSFYCINCGNKTYELPRKICHQYKSFHRKKLYCPYCRREFNAVECKNDEDVWDFKIMFKEGAFKDEATENALASCGVAGVG